tara:strand:- start:3220 stop:4170 length:951 start_codon:yes stop_codon:yes gene_type:complete
MLKKFFRKVRKVAKDIAPIAAPIAGFAFGAPVGMGIGALLGQYGGREGALRAAALGGIGGLAGNFAQTGKIFGTKGVMGDGGVGFKEGVKNLIGGQPSTVGGNTVRFGGGLADFAMSGKGLLTAGAIAAILSNKEEDDPEMRPEPEVGSQGQLGGLGDTTITYLDPLNPIYPKNQIGYGGAVPVYAKGGIAQLNKGASIDIKELETLMEDGNLTLEEAMDYLQSVQGKKEGGTVDDFGGIERFKRKNGKIEGPGTMTSDDIPAMLSDGEFVTKAVSVLGAGVKHGGAKTKEDARKKGAEFFYKQQKELEPFGKKVL